MHIKDYLFKRVSFFVISFIAIVIVAISATFAFNNLNDVNKISLESDLQVHFHNNSGVLENINYPISLDEGIEIAPANTISIKNMASKKKSFKVSVKHLNEHNTLDLSKIYCKVNNSEPMTLDKYPDGVIYTSDLESNSTEMIIVKLWVSLENIANDDQGKSSVLRFNVS